MVWLQFAIVLGAAAASSSLVTIQSECIQPTPQKNESLPDKLKKFPESYKVFAFLLQSYFLNYTQTIPALISSCGTFSLFLSHNLHFIVFFF